MKNSTDLQDPEMNMFAALMQRAQRLQQEQSHPEVQEFRQNQAQKIEELITQVERFDRSRG